MFHTSAAHVAQGKCPLKDEGLMAWPLLLLTVCDIWTACGLEIIK